MSNGGVEHAAWAELRPRLNLPSCVIDAVPSDDLQSFVHQVAVNPLHDFPHPSAARIKLLDVRAGRTSRSTLSTTTSRTANAKNAHTTTKPALPPSGSGPRKSLSAAQRNAARRRRETDIDVYAVPFSHPGTSASSSSSVEAPRRKQRRTSAVRTAAAASGSAIGTAVGTGTGIRPRVIVVPAIDVDALPGDDFDLRHSRPVSPSTIADHIPPELPREHWAAHPPAVLAKLVFSPHKFPGDVVDNFLKRLNRRMILRDGFPLSPFAQEVALRAIVKADGDAAKAVEATVANLPSGTFFPGIFSPFTYDEQCLFARVLTHYSKDFFVMSRTVMPKRTREELVWYYYGRYKQLTSQGGRPGLVVDGGCEPIKKANLPESVAAAMLQDLAKSRVDGYRCDARIEKIVVGLRNWNVSNERKRRDAEFFKRANRLRS